MRRGKRKSSLQRTPDLRVNHEIRESEVRVIDDKGEQLGIMHPKEGTRIAKSRSLDLVEVSPQASPSVCKIMDYGKFKYESAKKSREARQNRKSQEVREVKMRPKIGEHDYQVKSRMVTRLIEAGDKVKVTMRFRGREVVHADNGRELLQRIFEDVQEIAVIESQAKMEGRNMFMILAPK